MKQTGLEENKKKEIKEKGKVQGFAYRVLKYGVQGFEICNVKGSLKGKRKRKKKTLQSSGIA